MIFAHYSFGFFMLCVLGLTALIAAANGPTAGTPNLISSSIVSTTGDSSYILYVHTNVCPSKAGQVYTVTGTEGMFEVVNSQGLLTNTLNVVHVKTEKTIGTITSISFNLGTGGFALTQREICDVERVDLWDPKVQRGYSTSYAPDPSAADETSGIGRRLLGNNLAKEIAAVRKSFRGKCDVSQPVEVGGTFGQRVLTFQKTNSCEAVTLDAVESVRCTQLLRNSGFSPLCWAKQNCVTGFRSNINGKTNFLGVQVPCFNLGCDGNPAVHGVCNGHGQCTIMRTAGDSGNYTSRFSVTTVPKPGGRGSKRIRVPANYTTQGLKAVCDCEDGWIGDYCTEPTTSYCSSNHLAEGMREYDGQCTAISDPLAGTPGVIMNHLGTPGFLDGIELPRDFPSVYPTTNRNPDIGQMNQLAVGFIEFARRDLVELAYQSNGLPAPDNDTDVSPSSGTGVVGGQADGSCFAAALEFDNQQTGWLDASNLYDTVRVDDADLQLRFDIPSLMASLSDDAYSDQYRAVVRILAEVHNFMTFRASGHTIREIYEACRLATIYFYQNVLLHHLLPAFFEYLPANPEPGYQHTLKSYLDPMGASNLAEQPLNLVLDLTLSVRAPLAASPAVSPDCPAEEDFARQLRRMMTTRAKPFGTLLDNAQKDIYDDIHALAEEVGTSSWEQFRCFLLEADGLNFCLNRAGPNSTSKELGPIANRDFWNALHKEAQKVDTFNGKELLLAGTGFSKNVRSSWSPVALGLTHGVIRRALVSDPRSVVTSGYSTNAAFSSALQNVFGGDGTVAKITDDHDALSQFLVGQIGGLPACSGQALPFPLRWFDPTSLTPNAFGNSLAGCCVNSADAACTCVAASSSSSNGGGAGHYS